MDGSILKFIASNYFTCKKKKTNIEKDWENINKC